MTSSRRVVVMVVIVAAGCGGERAEQAGVLRRDSAGITIVEFDSANVDLPVWTASTTPVVAIGMVEGPEEYTLERVVDAHRLGDGDIVVVDGGATAVRFYDSTGTHFRSVGREGEGPGEFLWMGRSFVAPGDSVYVYDPRLRRLSVISPDGRFVRSFPLRLDDAHGEPHPRGVIANGRIVTPTGPGTIHPPGTRVVRDTIALLMYTSDGASADTLGFWPGDEQYISTTSGSTIIGGLMWGATSTFTVVANDIVVAETGRWEFRFVDGQGRTRQIVRNLAKPAEVTSADVARYRAGANGADVPESFRRRIAEAPLPEVFPAFGEVTVADDGELWVADFTAAAGEGPRSWLVIGPEGPVARAYTPAEMVRLFSANRDRVMGLRSDEMGVPQVIVLPLRKAAP